MAEPVSFKVHVTEIETKDQVDVGKFIVDKDVSKNFKHLQEKVTSVFPSLQNKTFTVNWTDEDGDIVTISSDEELAIALSEMKGPVYDIQIRVKGGEKKDDPNKSNTTGKVHPNVTCDGCEKSILGFRYKCLVCDDYDLCGRCESAEVHPGHNMLRIASPEGNFPQHFFKRLQRMQEKVERRRRCRQKREENQVIEEEGISDKLLHGKRFGGVGCGRFRALRARRGLYGGPHLGPFGVLYHGPCGRPHGRLHGRPHDRHHGGPHARPHGGLHGRLHGGPHCRPLGGLHEGPHGRHHGGWLGSPSDEPHDHHQGGLHWRPHSATHVGPFQIHHFAMRMARQNPDFYAAFLQATLSNSLTPHKLKIQPRRRLMNLRKGRILAGKTKGRNNTSESSPPHGGSITNEPDSTPKDQDDSAGHHLEEIVDC